MEKRDIVKIVSEQGLESDFSLEGSARDEEGMVVLEVTECGLKEIDSWPFPTDDVRGFANGHTKVLTNGSGFILSDDSEGQRAKIEFIWDPQGGRKARGYVQREELRTMLRALVGD